jgi:crossover junction endodeoxyribonuclease RusA
VILSFPFPSSELMPNRKNGRSHHASNAAKIKAREDAFWLAKAYPLHMTFKDFDGPIPLSIVYCPPDKRRRDLDNLLAASKATLDGLANAMCIDDTRFRPILINVGEIGKPGAMLVAVGVKIMTASDL